MYYVSEDFCRKAVSQSEINECIKEAFIATATGAATCFPIVRETLDYQSAVFGFKSGFDRNSPILGVKAGGLWPGNRLLGLENHQSTIMLFDPDTGAPYSLVRGTFLTALRTAAASALSIRYLARKNASSLGLIGAGGQAIHQLRAALTERPFNKVYLYDLNEKAVGNLVSVASDFDISLTPASPEEICAKADVIITVTPSTEPILFYEWLKPGVHLACMGADTKGKQEVSIDLITNATLFSDIPEQAVQLGECQHAANRDLISKNNINMLGAVINQTHQGRTDDHEITLFDSTGMALQDLTAAAFATSLALKSEQIVELT